MNKKVLSFLLGIIFSLVILEASLRILGFIQNLEQSKAASKIVSKTNKRKFVISSLGNSYTAGFGAPTDKSYSNQLNDLLNQRKPNYFKVINRGRGSVNTSYILENLPSWLKEDKPDIVFIMAGEPNSWNKYNYWNFLKKNNALNLYGTSFSLDFLRVFKLFNLVEMMINRDETWNENPSVNYSSTFKSIPKDEKHKSILGYLWLGGLLDGESYSLYNLTKEQQSEAIQSLEHIYKKHNNFIAARMLAEIYFFKKYNLILSLQYLESSIKMASYFDYAQYDLLKNYPKKDKAIAKKIESLNDEILKKKRKLSLESIESWYKTKEAPKEYGLIEELKYLIEISKTNPASYKIIDNIQFQLKQFDPDLVVELMKTTLELNPLSPNNNFIDSAYNIIETRPLLRKEFDDCMAKISHMLGELDFKSLIFREKLQTKWILSDIEEMIKLIHAEGAVAVVQTYPPFRDGSPRSIDLILRKWWSEKEKVKNLKFLDVGEKLESKLSKKNGGDKYYATQFGPMDNHLNAAGYLEIAKLMLPYVQEEESSRP